MDVISHFSSKCSKIVYPRGFCSGIASSFMFGDSDYVDITGSGNLQRMFMISYLDEEIIVSSMCISLRCPYSLFLF